MTTPEERAREIIDNKLAESGAPSKHREVSYLPTTVQLPGAIVNRTCSGR